MVRQIACVLVVAASAGTSCADMVYGQRPSAPEAGWFYGTGDPAALADDFTLPQDSIIQSVDFWTWGFSGSETFYIGVWSDEGGGNGVDNAGLIHTQAFSLADLNATSDAGMTRLTATFTSPFCLTSGMYWVSIGVSDGSSFIWATQGLSSPDPLGTPPIDFDNGGDNVWDGPAPVNPGLGLAFDVNGEQKGSIVVPLPAAPVFGLAGLSGVMIVKVRRTRRWR